MERGISHTPGVDGLRPSPGIAEQPYPAFDPRFPIPGREGPVVHERKVSPEVKATALHEMGHALMAYAHGVSVDYVSVIPNEEKGYKGITVLSYIPDDAYKLQMIAAAGSIFSEAGNGGDVHTINSLSLQSGKGKEEAFEDARKFRDYLSEAEWDVVASIVAERREIKGYEIPEILRQAKFEVAVREERGEQINLSYAVMDSWLQKTIIASKQRIVAAPKETVKTIEIIDEIRPNGIRISYQTENGDIVNDSIEVVCNHCRGKESHREDCQNKEIDLKAEKERMHVLPTKVFDYGKITSK